ncbi:MAG: invasion associated locus B family protein [Paracoccaceae bacterium]
MFNIRRSFIFSFFLCCYSISVLGLSPAAVASQEAAEEVNDISITRTQHDFWESICTLEQKIETCILRQTLRENSEEKRPFSMITIALKKEKMMFEVLLPLQIDLAFGLEMWSEYIDPKTYPFVTCVSQGCLVSFELEGSLLEKLMQNRAFSLRFRMLNAEEAILAKVSLKGFSRGIAKLNPIKS